MNEQQNPQDNVEIQDAKPEDISNDWLQGELKNIEDNKPKFEDLPSLQLEENKLTEFEIDFSDPFEKWDDKKNSVTKAKIIVIHEGTRKLFWLNIKNPLYHKLIEGGRNGKKKFKVTRTGQQQNTRYVLID